MILTVAATLHLTFSPAESQRNTIQIYCRIFFQKIVEYFGWFYIVCVNYSFNLFSKRGPVIKVEPGNQPETSHGVHVSLV